MGVKLRRQRIIVACLCSAVLALTGCTGSIVTGQTSSGQTPAIGLQTGSARSHHHAKNGLLYVADSSGFVYTFTYPGGSPVGHLGADADGGLCSDQSGNVFVTDFKNEKVYEYAHGGTTPIATLSPDAQPLDCSVDPLTGNLATVNSDDENTTSVSVFQNASGSPTKYTDASAGLGATCSYDDKGNLYVTGGNASQPFLIAELPHGSATFTNITVSGDFRGGNFLQWDGKYVSVTDAEPGKPVTVSRVEVSGSSGTVIGTTKLQGSVGYVKYFWIQGGTLITPKSGGGPRGRKIGLWKYPSGGSATNVVKLPKGGQSGPGIALGITVSVGGT